MLINKTHNIVTLIKLNTIHLYLDNDKNVLYFDVLNSNYSKINLFLFLKNKINFCLFAQKKQNNFNIIIKINSIGIYPLNFYTKLANCLCEFDNIFKNYLHSCAFIYTSSSPIIILKPLFSLYKFIRPYKICKTYEEALIFFNKKENQIVS